MANKVIKHYYYDDVAPRSPELLEPDKSKTISELSSVELSRMLNRIRDERELQNIIRDLKRLSGETSTFETPMITDSSTPINEMYHHGIMGMKWGVRRYQNPDGTRTPAGKKHEARHNSPPSSKDHTQSRQAKAKGTDRLSNEELKKLNERLQLESTYKSLTASDIKKSESWVKDSLKTIGKNSLQAVGTGVLVGSAKLLIKEISPELAKAGFGIKDDKKD